MAFGRPTEYQDNYPEKVFKLCLLGATDAEIADFFDIAESTLYLWKQEYTDFSEAIKRGKIQADADVANSLYKRANGYQYDEVTYEKIGDGDDKVEVGEAGMESVKQDKYKKKVVTKEVPPDVAAQNIWLKNRRSRVPKDAQRWADKHEIGVTDTEGNNVTPSLKLPDGTNLEL